MTIKNSITSFFFCQNFKTDTLLKKFQVNCCHSRKIFYESEYLESLQTYLQKIGNYITCKGIKQVDAATGLAHL